MNTVVFDKVHAFFIKYPKRSYPKDQILIFAGENPEKVCYITTGRVSKYDISYRGDEVAVNSYKPPAFFPVSWAINKTKNDFYYKTDEPCIIHRAPPEDVVAFLKANPDVLFELLSRVYTGVDGLLSRMVHLMTGSAKSRLIYELIVESKRFGKKRRDGTIALTITESKLGSYSGLARETISREMRFLKDRGLVKTESGKIIVINLRNLEERLKQVV